MSVRRQRGHLNGRKLKSVHRVAGLVVILFVLLTGCTFSTSGYGRPLDAYVDPQGSYTLIVPPDWSPIDPGDDGSSQESWSVPGEPGAAPSLVVLQTLGNEESEGNGGMISYLYAYQELIPEAFPEPVDFNGVEMVTGSAGDLLGLVDFSTTSDGQRNRFLDVIALDASETVTATFFASADLFEALIPSVRSALLSLHKT